MADLLNDLCGNVLMAYGIEEDDQFNEIDEARILMPDEEKKDSVRYSGIDFNVTQSEIATEQGMHKLSLTGVCVIEDDKWEPPVNTVRDSTLS